MAYLLNVISAELLSVAEIFRAYRLLQDNLTLALAQMSKMLQDCASCDLGMKHKAESVPQSIIRYGKNKFFPFVLVHKRAAQTQIYKFKNLVM